MQHPSRNFRLLTATTVFVAAAFSAAASMAQEAEPYVRGERRRLLITVQILGEVKSPGEFSVPDDTDILGLVAKAGGGTEFANLSAVRVTHRTPVRSAGPGVGLGTESTSAETVNLQRYLSGALGMGMPLLQPGDVVMVPRNSWSRWRTVAVVFRDVSVVASAVFLGIRAMDNR